MQLLREWATKVQEFVKKNKFWMIWGGVVLIISILFISLILWTRNQEKQKEVPLIENPLENNVKHPVVISKKLIEESDHPEELEVYDLINKNYHIEVDTFLTILRQDNYIKSNVQNSLYLWSKGESYLEYVIDSQNLFFRFEDPVITGIDASDGSRESAAEYMSAFYKKLFDRDYEFTNIVVKREGNRSRIEGNRILNGLPIYTRGYTTYTDYLVVDAFGRVSEGNLLLVEADVSKNEKVNLVDISNLQYAMSRIDYPKEVFQVYGVRGHVHEDGEEEHPDDVDNFGEEPPIASNSVAGSVRLIYYFASMKVKNFSPTYRIESEGTISFEGELINVPLVIYANALDPARVYIPGEGN